MLSEHNKRTDVVSMEVVADNLCVTVVPAHTANRPSICSIVAHFNYSSDGISVSVIHVGVCLVSKTDLSIATRSCIEERIDLVDTCTQT